MILKSFSCLQKLLCIVIMQVFRLEPVHNPDEWHLFIDSLQISLKAVFLHNGNIYPPVPLAYSFHVKKSHESICSLLNSMDYDECKWKMCGDMKVLELLLGMLPSLH